VKDPERTDAQHSSPKTSMPSFEGGGGKGETRKRIAPPVLYTKEICPKRETRGKRTLSTSLGKSDSEGAKKDDGKNKRVFLCHLGKGKREASGEKTGKRYIFSPTKGETPFKDAMEGGKGST